MTFVDILLIISSLANLLLSIFVVFRADRRDYKRFTLGLMSMGVFFWCLSLLFYRLSGDIYTITFWGKMAHVWGSVLGPLLIYFVIFFIHKSVSKRQRIFLGILGVLFFVFAITILSTDLIVGPAYVENGINNMEIPMGYYAFIFYINIHFLLGFYLLIKRYLKVSGVEKEQIRYILIGTIISALAAVTFDVIYPLFIDFSLNWIGPVLTIVMVLSMSYAIIKYRLMNIKLAITRSVLYTLLVGTVAIFFALSTTLATNYLEVHSDQGKITVYIVNSLLIVIFFDPIKELFARITDKVFYKDKIDYQKLLQEAGNIIAKEIDLKLLSEKLSSLLSSRLKIKTTYIYDNELKKLASYGHKAIEFNDNLAGFLGVQTDVIVIEELIRDINNDRYDYNSKELNKIVDSLQNLGIEMIVPIIDEEKHIAYLLLSEKQSGDLYNEEDIEFFKVLIPQIASAFEKSQLYNEVQKFNVKLQKKVEEKTSSLKEANEALEARNKFLTTMQVVANMLSRTLDLKQVTQMIADSISTELGYVGGIVSFVDDKRKHLQIKAITNSEETKMILNTLPEDLKSFEAELKINYNLAVDTVLTGEMKYSQNLSDFICPPADEEIIGVAQEALQIKTVVGVPIYSEDRVIGLINFLLPFPEEDISFLDREIMTAMTNQVGILYRNLELYDNLQGTNKELQEANVHLRALDKAKSEFVSIASHQLRTPISAIKGYLSMLMEGDFGQLSDGVKNVIEGLFESSSRLARLVNTFLNVSRIESGRLKLDIKPVNVDTLVKSVVEELSNEAAQKGLKLTYDSPKDLPKAMADSDKLREVILNLIDNSIKYTPKGSVKVSLSADNEKLSFQVKDTGIGIDPVEAKGLFRKFVRGSGVAQIHTGGSGLGLFIAQRIINEHKGKIWAESEGREKGSAFKFEVPIEKN